MENLELQKLRNQINKIDSDLFKVLVKRFKITDKIKLFKKRNDLPIEDKDRELEIIEKAKKTAVKLKIKPELVKSILEIIIKEVKK